MSKRGRDEGDAADGAESKKTPKQMRHQAAMGRTEGRLSSPAAARSARGVGDGGATVANQATELGTTVLLHACFPRVEELSGRLEEPQHSGRSIDVTSTSTSVSSSMPGSGGSARSETAVRESVTDGHGEIPLLSQPRSYSSTSATSSNFTPKSSVSNFTPDFTASNFTPNFTASNFTPNFTASNFTPNFTASNFTPNFTASNFTPNFTASNFTPNFTASNFTPNSTISNPAHYSISTANSSNPNFTISNSPSTTNSTPFRTSNSSSTPSDSGRRGSSSDRERRAKRRVELRVQEARDRATRSRTAPSQLGEDLCQAAQEGRLDAVRRLLDSGAAVNYTDAQGDTPLLLALFPTPQEEVVALLLERGADPDAVDAEGVSALHLSTYQRSARCVQLLLAAGADPDARKLTGSTALHYAADVGNEAATRALLAAGANTALRGWEAVWKDMTPMDVATSERIRSLLGQSRSMSQH